MNYAVNLPLKIGFYGNDVPPVTLRYYLILQNFPNFRPPEELLQGSADLLPGGLHLLAQPPQLLAGLVKNQPMRTDGFLNGLPDFGQIAQLRSISGYKWLSFLAALEITPHSGDQAQNR